MKTAMKIIRKKRKMSLHEVSVNSGISLEKILRMETGRYPIRFSDAVKICETLDEKFVVVFPEALPIMEKIQSSGVSWEKLIFEDKYKTQMEQIGFDMDPALHFFKYRLRGGAEGVLPVSSFVKDKLWDVVQRTKETENPFIVFDAGGARIVLNLDHLIFCHFLFEAADRENDYEIDNVKVYLTESTKPVELSVEADTEEDMQLEYIITMAATEIGENDVFSLTDVDGETAFIRAGDVTMIEIPLRYLDPELWEDDEEEEE